MQTHNHDEDDYRYPIKESPTTEDVEGTQSVVGPIQPRESLEELRKFLLPLMAGVCDR